MRILTESEMKQLEEWARQTRLAEMLTFFESLPRLFTAPRAVLLGSNGPREILIEGLITKHRACRAISDLDEPFNPNLNLQKTLMSEKREKPIGTMQPIYRGLAKGMDEVCLASHMGVCSEKIAQAHTVQKAAFRQYATPDGHMYEIDPFKATPGGHMISRVGINEATTMTGFCANHDREIFKPIETVPFVSSPQQLFLFHYRAVAQALYNRVHAFKIIEEAHNENAKKPGIGSLATSERTIRNTHLDAGEIRRHKVFYDQKLLDKDWSVVEGYAWIGNKAPDIFATDFVGPKKDLQGRTIQHTKGPYPLLWLSLTVTAVDGRALVLLCGDRGSPALAALVASIRRLPRNLRTMAVVNYIICQIENFVIVPRWWDGLSAAGQRCIVNAYDSRYFPRTLPPVCQWNLSEYSIAPV